MLSVVSALVLIAAALWLVCVVWWVVNAIRIERTLNRWREGSWGKAYKLINTNFNMALILLVVPVIAMLLVALASCGAALSR